MGRIILHKGKRKDNGEVVVGFLTKMRGEYHIVLVDDENTTYPVEEDSIEAYVEKIGSKLYNRYYHYASDKMLPRLQDTVLICKGWYDDDKYKSIYEALRAYWAKLAGMKPEDVCYDNVLNALLLPACEAFLSPRQFCEIFYERIFKQDIVFREFRSRLHRKEKAEWQEMDPEYLIDLLVNALFKLSRDEYQDTRKLEEGYCVI